VAPRGGMTSTLTAHRRFAARGRRPAPLLVLPGVAEAATATLPFAVLGADAAGHLGIDPGSTLTSGSGWAAGGSTPPASSTPPPTPRNRRLHPRRLPRRTGLPRLRRPPHHHLRRVPVVLGWEATPSQVNGCRHTCVGRSLPGRRPAFPLILRRVLPGTRREAIVGACRWDAQSICRSRTRTPVACCASARSRVAGAVPARDGRPTTPGAGAWAVGRLLAARATTAAPVGLHRPGVVTGGVASPAAAASPRCNLAPKLGRAGKRLCTVTVDGLNTARAPPPAPPGIPRMRTRLHETGTDKFPPQGVSPSPASP
jgi:hypothetical protein